jgi:DNA-3-methyladenine glycosylase
MNKAKRLTRAFFIRDGITVATDLLGKILVHHTKLGVIRGTITETESYMGVTDKASHTYGGRRTSRTETMYHIGGTSYIYMIYGMYNCMNITTMEDGIPQAVLLRQVVAADEESKERMIWLRTARQRTGARMRGMHGMRDIITQDDIVHDMRKTYTDAKHTPGKYDACSNVLKHLGDGPGKLCMAMGISRAQNNIDMVSSPDLYVTEGITVEPSQIRAGKRIGIDYAEEAAEYMWRFWI